MAYNHLKLAFEEGGGAESLESVLSEKQQDGDARVTKISLLLLNFILILVHVLTNFDLEPIISQ